MPKKKLINGNPKFQPLPDLPDEEFEALKADIRANGLQYPVIQDDKGNTLDGHQRERALTELRIKNYPVKVIAGLTEEQKWHYAIAVNVKRRNLTTAQKRTLIEREIKRTPDIAAQWHSEILGVDIKTIQATRKRLEATLEIPVLKKLRGKDGKKRNVRYVLANTPNELLKARAIARQMPLNGKVQDTITASRYARRCDQAEIRNGKVVKRLSSDSIKIFHCPFQKLEQKAGIRPGSFDLILTDPPYGKNFLPELDDLGAFAERVLKDGGLFVMYSGQFHLDVVMQTIGKHLKYRWMIATSWDGDASLIHPLNITSKWKPILIFSKGNWVKRGRWVDLLQQNSKEKSLHEWQQPLEEAEILVEYFSEPGDTIIDPLGGSFTTGVASFNLGRRFIGCDIDLKCVKKGRQRLGKAVGERSYPS
jgi:site-specific DNA-methyltransferase (adenine-specific)